VKLWRGALAGWLTFAAAAAQSVSPSPLLRTLKEELDRNFAALQAKGDPPPYFASYAVTEIQTESVTASFGALQGASGQAQRFLDVSVRVGSPELDNYRVVRGERPRFASGLGIPLDNEVVALRRRVWLETDRVYRAAVQRLMAIKTALQNEPRKDAAPPDFSQEAPQRHSQLPPPLKVDREAWCAKARQWSAVLAGQPGILASQVTIQAQREAKYFVNTEGTEIEHGRTYARIVITAQGKAADGMDLVATESFEADDPSRLPPEARVIAGVEKVKSDLLALLRAPVVEPYVGPAILSGRAAGVFFHEIFGHRIEGHRQKDDTEGQTFANSVGSRILPEFLSVSFDATRRQAGGVDLNGWYRFDDEGVAGTAVKLVDQGILRTFLLSRSPLEVGGHSNGHGRKQPGAEVVARQSNLIVESSRQVPFAQLRALLVEEAKRQKKPYGLYFEQVTGGFTTTGRRGLQAFTVIPLVVYRIWADGRPDELVRGADIVGTPLASFAKILATGDRLEVFNGYCGAESGTVPVSAVAPAILVSEIEIQKKDRSLDRPPYLSRPSERAE